MKKLIFVLLLVLLIAETPVTAQDLSGISGAFADIGYGARPAGMGFAYAGLANDVHSVMWNPAGLTNTSKKEAAFTYTDQLGLISYNYLAGSMPLSRDKRKAIGAALLVSGDDMMREFTLQGSYAQILYGVKVGATLKMRYASFGNNSINASDYVIFEPDEIQEGQMNQVYGSAVGFGFDVGFQYDMTKDLRLGLMFKDIYSPMYWDSKNDNEINKPKGSYSETIPFEMVLGTAFRVNKNIIFAADYAPNIMDDVDTRFSWGGEVKWFDILYTRGGMVHYVNDREDDKYSIGTGLDLKVIRKLRVLVDFTYMFEELDNTLRFSLGFEFM